MENTNDTRVTGYGLDDCGSIPGRGKNHFCRHCVQDISGGSFLRGKATSIWCRN